MPLPNRFKLCRLGFVTVTMNKDKPLRVAIVTGANTGVGKETVRGLARSGTFKLIVLACRSENKALKAIEGEISRLVVHAVA